MTEERLKDFEYQSMGQRGPMNELLAEIRRLQTEVADMRHDRRLRMEQCTEFRKENERLRRLIEAREEVIQEIDDATLQQRLWDLEASVTNLVDAGKRAFVENHDLSERVKRLERLCSH